MPERLTIGPSLQLFAETEQLLAGRPVWLINPLVHTNAREIGAPAAARWLHRTSAAALVAQPPVVLGRYPTGTCLNGGGSFQLQLPCGAWGEQPALPTEDVRASRLTTEHGLGTPVAVDRPCLLAARAGAWCWGHWLLDMLPRIVVAERLRPGLFTFAVPGDIVDATSPSGYVRSVLGSLAAYGIGAGRLLRLRSDTMYRFTNLFELCGISGKHMHPDVLAAMRDLPEDEADRSATPMLAVLRGAPTARRLANLDAIKSGLAEAGCAFLDPLTASFANQLRAIRGSTVVVGDLGSNLACMIYARAGTGLVSLAPVGWRDDYFQKLFQRLDIYQADLRGVSAPAAGEGIARAPHFVNPADVSAGVAAVRDAGGVAVVDGRRVCRAAGARLHKFDFRNGGNAAALVQSGFSNPEPAGTWAIGARSEVHLPRPGGAVWLFIRGRGHCYPPYLASIPFIVSVNGERLAEFDVEEETCLQLRVPPVGGSGFVVTFDHPICPSPMSLGEGGDTRSLGFLFTEIEMFELHME